MFTAQREAEERWEEADRDEDTLTRKEGDVGDRRSYLIFSVDLVFCLLVQSVPIISKLSEFHSLCFKGGVSTGSHINA